MAKYQVASCHLGDILAALRDEGGFCAPEVFEQLLCLLVDIEAADPANVAFDWAFCPACAPEGFRAGGNDTTIVLDLVQLLLDRGYMASFSDASLHSLIQAWDRQPCPGLGPNPFVDLGETCGGQATVRFDPRLLALCPSARLQCAGQLCREGRATVVAPSGALAYALDWEVAARAGVYEVEVLTVATDLPGVSATVRGHLSCEAGGFHGAAGHVLLKYASGGVLLTSAGRLAEPISSKAGSVTEDRFLRAVNASYGQEVLANVRKELDASPGAEARKQTVQRLAWQFIQHTVPCGPRLGQRWANLG